jgi:hypothetical protein
MPFPISPVDGEFYTNHLGTRYVYRESTTSWDICLQEIQGNTGLQGQTGAQGLGVTGLQGDTGLVGSTGLQGETGLQGLTGLQGETGAQGATGLQGLTGLIGGTGVQGNTGVFVPAQYNAGSIGATGAFIVNWSNGLKQVASIALGATGCTLGFSNGVTGANSTLVLTYTVNGSVQGITGVQWSAATSPTLSGATSSTDVIGFYFNGNYLGMAGTGFKY